MSAHSPGEDFAEVLFHGNSYTVCVPNAGTDYIQGMIARTGRPYEEKMLDALASVLSQGDLFVDVGANIGNHSLALAVATGCRVFAYEPDEQLVDALDESVLANDLGAFVTTRRVGVGRAAARARLAGLDPSNIGAQHLDMDEHGGIEVVRLDDEPLGDVAVIKIDVEGMELDVLEGAVATIARSRPEIFVEAAERSHFERVVHLLDGLGYVLVGSYNATPTHHFTHRDRPSALDAVSRANVAATADTYDRVADERAARAKLDDAAARYRLTQTQLAEARAERDALVVRRDDDARLARGLNAALSRLSGEAAQLAARIAELESQAVRQRRQARATAARLAELEGRKSVRAANYAGEVVRNPRALRKVGSRMRAALRGSSAQRVDGASSQQFASIATTVWSEAPRFSTRRIDEADARAERARERLRNIDIEGRGLRVAAIVDPFTQSGLERDCTLINLTRADWRAQIEALDPDILFVESAWRGAGGTWHNAVPRVPSELQELLGWCRERHVATVFWNKEDPIHFDTFLSAALEFDHVYTTDVDMIPHYRRELGHDRVYLLPFASQPRHFNPMYAGERRPAMVFAGGYYRRYAERMRDLDAALEGAQEVLPVEIFDRNLGTQMGDYAFPERFAHLVVGSLAPEDVDMAHKRYEIALNLNSVKGSSSMFARRVFETLMCGTPTVSNYSRGLSLVFGDLVPTSDSAVGFTANLARLRDDIQYRDRLRTLGLRKVLREHTYAERLRRITSHVRGEMHAPQDMRVGVLARVSSVAELDSVIHAVKAQRGVDAELVIVADVPEVRAAARPARVLRWSEAVELTLGELFPAMAVSVFHPADSYLADYLVSLLQADLYAPDAYATKADYYRFRDGHVDRMNGGSEHRVVVAGDLPSRRTLIPRARSRDLTCAAVLGDAFDLEPDAAVVSVDRFDYCEGAEDDPRAIAVVTSAADLNAGLSLSAFDEAVMNLEPESHSADFAPIVVDDGFLRRARRAGFSVGRAGFGTVTLRRFSDAGHRGLWFSEPLRAQSPGSIVRLRIEALGDLDFWGTARWRDDDGEVLRVDRLEVDVNHELEVPTNAATVQYGVRLAGVGTLSLRYFAFGHREAVPAVAIGRSDTLVLADAYPSAADLYKYGFVHSRVRNYLSAGREVDVFRFSRFARPGFYEFEGVDVETGGAGALEAILATGTYRRVLVHFLNPEEWSVLRKLAGEVDITVWLHGAEVQPWWRRVYATEEDLALAKDRTPSRLAFWRDLVDTAPASTKLVVVSNAFRDEISEDLDRDLSGQRFTVIHNPIDTEIFTYEPKTPDDRLRIVSVRPYFGPKYANDLAVAAVVDLAAESWFGELQFTFAGEGPYFDEITQPLLQFDNVEVARGFLTQHEIARLYRRMGVCLVPTRVDAQGVSRDEAMACGLVPVTSDIPAVREFVTDAEGYAAPIDDYRALADAIRDMYAHPETFMRKSVAAAQRVRSQTAANIVLARELEVGWRDHSP